MQNPGQGLAGLNSKLKPGGYFKIGLYSKLARQNVSTARELIQNLGIPSTPEGIRDFRKQVFDDKNMVSKIYLNLRMTSIRSQSAATFAFTFRSISSPLRPWKNF